MQTAPQPTYRHILGDSAESSPLDPPCREVALHGRGKRHEDGWPAQCHGASLRYRFACVACKHARSRGACHQCWLAANSGWKCCTAPGSARNGAAVPFARPIKDIEESPLSASDLMFPTLRGQAGVAWFPGVRLRGIWFATGVGGVVSNARGCGVRRRHARLPWNESPEAIAAQCAATAMRRLFLETVRRGSFAVFIRAGLAGTTPDRGGTVRLCSAVMMLNWQAVCAAARDGFDRPSARCDRRAIASSTSLASAIAACGRRSAAAKPSRACAPDSMAVARACALRRARSTSEGLP